MKKLYKIVFLSFFTFSVNSSDQKTAHIFIKEWKPGSYGNVKSAGRNAPLPIWIWVQFDQQIADDQAKKILDFLIKSLRVLDRSVYYKPIENHLGTYFLVVQSFITREQLQLFIDKTNKHFDPAFKTVQEIKILNIQNELEAKELQLLEEKAIIAQEKIIFEEQKRKIAEEQRKINEDKNKIMVEKNKLEQNKILQEKELNRLKSIPTPSAPSPIVKTQPQPQLVKAIQNSIPQAETGFEPIRQEAMRRFDQETYPKIVNDFSVLTNGSPFLSSGFKYYVQRAYSDVEFELADLEVKYMLQKKAAEFQKFTQAQKQAAIENIFTRIGKEADQIFSQTKNSVGREQFMSKLAALKAHYLLSI